ncbi:MAG: hypothetical protein ABUK01_13095 [Leptospirales bacterium]
MDEKRTQYFSDITDNFTSKMHYHWKYIKGRDGEFPEVYILYTDGNRIKVEANKDRKKVRLYVESANGNIVQSSIINGIVIEEKDMLGNLETSIGDEFCFLSNELSSIPDTKILRLIDGKYGILTEFLGKITRQKNQDVQTIKRIFQGIVSFPGKVYQRFIHFLEDLFEKPSAWDILDFCVVASLGYLAYIQNFNYFFGGVIAVAGALLSGYTDWLWRKKDPYLLKLFMILIPAVYVVRYGLIYQ